MKKIRIGIMGAGRGLCIAENFALLGCEIVALCENNPQRVEYGKREFGFDIPVYENFDEFLELDLDAVVLANFFHEHAPYAIKCFEKGVHVFSECISNGTMAEGVELIRAFEKSNSIYMLAENYPQMKFNREMKRVCDGGTLGKVLYAEGEYNHPASPYDSRFLKDYIYFEHHWRNLLPRSYYITHSLAPVMWATGATPKKVSAMATFTPFEYETSARLVADRAAIVTTFNDDGSVFRVSGCAAFGAHHNAYRICGTNGQIENIRGMGEKIMLRYSDWAVPEGMEEVNCYDPEWHDKDEEFIETSGHGGGDYIVARMFLDCIREGRQPEHPYDIYSAVTMASVAILAHRSILNGSNAYDVPDFRLEECRKEYENDRQTPFYGSDGSEPNIPCCSVTDYKPTQAQFENFRKALED